MKILFMSLLDFSSIEERNIYTDLLREFRNQGDEVYIVSPVERRTGEKSRIIKEHNCTILKLKIGNIQKTNIFEKGVSTIMVEHQIIKGIRKYFSGVIFDLVLYSTPPITIYKPVQFLKKRDNAKTYLMLKDIFPQNAVDIGVLSKKGVTSGIYKYFRRKEKMLYSVSDYIGCMSQANVDYLLEHNPEIDRRKVGICPNSIEVQDKSIGRLRKREIRRKYNIPMDKKVYIYGGNIGKPQGVEFLIECLESEKENEDVFFIVVGDGTEYKKIESYCFSSGQQNLRLMPKIKKDDYELLVAASDVGLIFLDHRFTVPNFPSRLLSYMVAKIPVIAATDTNTDLKSVIEGEGFGWWCESNNVDQFKRCIKESLEKKIDVRREWRYLNENFSVLQTCHIIKNAVLRDDWGSSISP